MEAYNSLSLKFRFINTFTVTNQNANRRLEASLLDLRFKNSKFAKVAVIPQCRICHLAWSTNRELPLTAKFKNATFFYQDLK